MNSKISKHEIDSINCAVQDITGILEAIQQGKGDLVGFVWHCTATPITLDVTTDMLDTWHLAPKKLSYGGVMYGGRTYESYNDLPNEKIGGIPIKQLKGNGWSRGGYNIFVPLSGKTVIMQPFDSDDHVESKEMRWGVSGKNANWLHLCYAGGVDENNDPKDTRNKEQLAAMEAITKMLLMFFPNALFAGHNQHAAKACPSFDVPEWLKSIGVEEKNIYKK